MMQPPFRIGTAGWNIPSLYLDQIPPGGNHLERYGRHLTAVEINSSFYRPHRRTTYQRWAQCVPDDFRFAVKLPKAITHQASLVDCGALLDRFVDEVTGLGDKLGVLVVQLPPKSALSKRIADRFFRDLRARIDTDVVLEPRHGSWFAPGVGNWLRNAASPASPPTRREFPGPASPAVGISSYTIGGMVRRGFIIRIMAPRL